MAAYNQTNKMLPQLNRKQLFITMKKNWLSLSITIILSGFMIALPAFFYLFTYQFSKLIGEPKEQQQFSVFLQPQINENQKENTLEKIRQINQIGKVEFITQEKALEEMQQIEGVAIAIDILKINPLHDSVVITPQTNLNQAQLEQLKEELLAIDYVKDIRIDEQWAVVMSQMIHKTTQFLKIFGFIAAMIISSMLFYFSMLKSFGNRQEIRLKYLLGAYPWQLYKPYVILGIINGFFSGVISIIIVSIAYSIYSGLWKSWEMDKLLGEQVILPLELLTIMILGSTLLGMLSSFLANYWVNHQINQDTQK